MFYTVDLIQLLIILSTFSGSESAGCAYISADAGCQQCNEQGHCVRGTVPVEPWLKFALKTQRDLQADEPFFNVQILDAHNAFNTRADNYGGNDTCAWPPPYKRPCYAFANQEFSFTDMLNMGIRGFEIDNYWCKNDMRMAHLGSDLKLLCFERTRTFSDGMNEIGEWLRLTGNSNELIRIYLDRPGSGYDEIVNNILLESFGNRILTPSELTERYGGVWPTMKTLQEDSNNVIILTNSVDDLGGKTIHRASWTNRKFGSFTPYPLCGGKSPGSPGTWRFYGDGTHYPIFWDGPTQTGVVTDLTEVMKCHVQYPAMDFVNKQMLRTAVFTWADGEPSIPLTSESCIFLSGSDHRWHVASSCYRNLYFACQHREFKDKWTLSEKAGHYSLQNVNCPHMFEFCIPQNGYRNQKLLELIGDKDVWINYSPWLPGYVPLPEEPDPTNYFSASSTFTCSTLLLISSLILIGNI
ncbi:hypothetical protein HOLleu_05948 [Holothuria leucospilota]|uniref:Uncharacterized protein n=1 Tax=Holothuria leucospilota TaxID=206669 RepID=A0A9Q1HJ92_HOLLE|nr:hypothetical protein HOLleu_05948 [Holothuria leucospilota]